MNVNIGSSSKIEIEAVREAIAQVFGRVPLVLMANEVASGVPEQPEGSQTYQGAENRAKGALAQGTFNGEEVTYAVGIENGIDGLLESLPPECEEFGIVHILDSQGGSFMVRTESVYFPVECYEEAEKRGFDKTTLGAVLAEQTGCDPEDPHLHLTGKSRKDYLVEALVKAFTKAKEAR